MGTKTADEAGAGTGTEAATDEEKVDVTKSGDVTEDAAEPADILSAGDEDGDELPEARVKEPSIVGQGAGAIVSAAIGMVSLSGSWVGTVASARENINGQLEMQAVSNPSIATQLEAQYGDAWHATALWGGIFALVALIVGVAVLARPAFGVPGKPQPVWIKSVSWAGVSLGVIGLLLAVLKYTDVLLGLPST
ncbi:hypothetical protein [Streptomyces blattellae]|uniref:hypothetical protein n=1 Tax=Streptomyces blattellae TaxID=2569855 RepID=UPI0012B6CC0D|nr:hypothetical protein [Streptomyces blattellae]